MKAAVALLAVLSTLAPALASADDGIEAELGRRIYVDGVLGSGAPLVGTRPAGGEIRGHQAACVACHRASGMGSVEGNVRIQPISGRYLFPADRDLRMANMDGIRGKTINRTHAPYNEALLGRALLQGVDASGRNLNALMPHYALAPADLSALRAYLAGLSNEYSAGAKTDVIRFATVVTPEVPADKRKAFLDMLQAAVVTKNSSTLPRKRYMTMAANFVTQTERRWDVEVWSLRGEPSTWQAQLEARYRAAPVFALLSGLSDGPWEPVQAFAASHRLPVWFPSVPVPPQAASDGSLYFSRGALLEAEVLASFLSMAAPGPRQMLQVHVKSTPGEAAAQRLRQAWQGAAADLLDIAIDSQDAAALGAALAQAQPGADVALWLDAEHLRGLAALPPPAGRDQRVFVSRSLGGPVAGSLPAAWQAAARWVYPYELPQAREANLSYFHSWLKLRNLPLFDEELQSELFFSLNLMTDTLQDMIDNLYRDYLVERTEDMLGKRESSKAEQESRDRRALGRAARKAVDAELPHATAVMDALDAGTAQRRAFGAADSTGTSVYPRLALGPGQHFASKGAYIVRADPASARRLIAESEWIVP